MRGLALLLMLTFTGVAAANEPLKNLPSNSGPVSGYPGPVSGFQGMWPAARHCGPRWYGGVEALWLERTTANKRNLSILDNAGIANDRFLLNTTDPRFNLEPGLRVTIGGMIDDYWSLEGVYFGLHEHQGTAASPSFPSGVGVFGFLQPYWASSGLSGFGSTSQALVNPTLGFTNSFQHIATYSSELHNIEANLRTPSGSGLSVLFGIRYVNVDERFDFISIDEDPADDVGGDGPGGGRYSVRTRNNLLGLQGGGSYDLALLGNRLLLSATGKAGIFVNFAEQSSHLFSESENNQSNTPNPLNIRGGAEQARIATLIEFGLFATARVTNAISVKAGYNLFFINGLALAPDNLDAAPYTPGAMNLLNANGSTIYHGPSVGVTAQW